MDTNKFNTNVHRCKTVRYDCEWMYIIRRKWEWNKQFDIPFTAQELLYVPPALTDRNSLFCPHCIYVFCMDLRTIAIISLYSINLSVFIIQAESVYCAVRTGSSNQTNTVSSLKCWVSALNNRAEISVFHILLWEFWLRYFGFRTVWSLRCLLKSRKNVIFPSSG